MAAIVLVLVGSALVLLARRSRSGKLRRNRFAGVRTATTMSSDEAWHAAQRASAGFTLLAGCGAIAGGLVVAVVVLVGRDSLPLPDVASTLVLVTAAWAAGWAIAGGVAGQHAARGITLPR
jgi:ABC-type sugar transport system permease subunit